MRYNYIINRDVSNGKASIEALDDEFNATKIGEADIKVSGQVMQVAVPLALINKTEEDAHRSFKVAEHITDQSDIMEYYIICDSAPIGRVNYTYGYW